MNAAHVHLLLNHIPVIGLPIILALFIFGIVRQSDELKKASLLAFVLMAIVAIPSFLSGEPAEDVLEQAPGVGEAFISTHEAAAAVALSGAVLLGLLATVAYVIYRIKRSWNTIVFILLTATALFTTGLMSWTAHLGGKIRHTEIRSDTAPAVKDIPEPTEKDED